MIRRISMFLNRDLSSKYYPIWANDRPKVYGGFRVGSVTPSKIRAWYVDAGTPLAQNVAANAVSADE